MTDFTAIPDISVDPDAPVTSELMYALRDNAVAIAEGAVGAPYLATSWHPVGGVFVGDGVTGILYDFAVHGAVASVESALFQDGYEYEFWFEDVRPPSGISQSIRAEWYRATSAAYSNPDPISPATLNSSTGAGGRLTISRPSFTARNMLFEARLAAIGSNATTALSAYAYMVLHTTAQKVSKVRFSIPSGIGGGKIRAYQRKVQL